MAIYIARQTINKIDSSIQADSGNAYRGWLQRVLPHIGDAYRQDEGGFRSHMGASLLGNECARVPWYNFRWTVKGQFEGRMMRLFNRGHLEEARFIAMLLSIGTEIYQQDENGKQFRISFADGHGGGSGDGIGKGLPEVPETSVLCEFKTHGEKSFMELAGKLDEWRAHLAGKGPFTGKGVREAKFEHYVQMQLYMRKMELVAGLYMAVNKNTDDLYAEIVPLDTEIADMFFTRGEKLVPMHVPPERLSNSPGFWKCRFCEYKPVCHLKAKPEVNCRTCIYSEPQEDATWFCNLHKKKLSFNMQLSGCEKYELSKAYG